MQIPPDRFGSYVRTENGFRRFGTVCFGTLASVGLLWLFGSIFGTIVWWMFLIALAFGAAWVWAFLMWQALKGEIARINAKVQAAKRASDVPHGT